MKINSLLPNFQNELNVAIIGSSGGIGKALTDLLVLENKVKSVYCFSRSPTTKQNPKIKSCSIDITDEMSVKEAASELKEQQLDIIIVASGILHTETVSPEKNIKALNMEQFNTVFAVNAFGPALVAKHFLPFIPRFRRSVFSVLSARVGSIEDNKLGGWYAYRASKAALNMFIKNIAIETERRYKHTCIVGLHPGTVDTKLSEPFQSNVAANKLFTTEYSAQQLLNVINKITPDNSGEVLAWNGQRIPY